MKKSTEPAVTIGAISAAVAAVLACLISFGVPLTEGQTTALLGVVAAAGSLITGIVVRQYVTPVSTLPRRAADEGSPGVE